MDMLLPAARLGRHYAYAMDMMLPPTWLGRVLSLPTHRSRKAATRGSEIASSGADYRYAEWGAEWRAERRHLQHVSLG